MVTRTNRHVHADSANLRARGTTTCHGVCRMFSLMSVVIEWQTLRNSSQNT